MIWICLKRIVWSIATDWSFAIVMDTKDWYELDNKDCKDFKLSKKIKFVAAMSPPTRRNTIS